MGKRTTLSTYVKQRVVRLHQESHWPQRLIAHAFDLKVPTVNNILHRFKKLGPDALTDRRRNNPGNPRKVTH